MKTMKILPVLMTLILFAATASAQIDLPFEVYGDKVDIIYPQELSDTIIDLNSSISGYSAAVSRDGQLYAQPVLSGDGGYIYLASYPDMILTEILHLDDITFDYPVSGIYSLLFHSDNTHIIYRTDIYDPERGGTYTVDGNSTSRSNGLATICMVNVQTGEHEVLIEGGYAREVSPDGRYLLYTIEDFRKYTIDISAAVDEGAWALYDFVTGESTLLRDIFDDDIVNSTTAMTFSPDGTSLYYLKGTGGPNGKYGQQLYKVSLGGSSVTQISGFVYPDDDDSADWVRLQSLALSPDEEWAVTTGRVKYGRDYLLMYELASGRIWSLYTGEEISSDFHEMIEYQYYIIATYGDTDGDGGYYSQSLHVSALGDTTYTINGVEYDYNEFHLVDPRFVGWHPDGKTLVMYCREIGGGGIYYKSFDPVFYKGSPLVVENAAPEEFATIANYPNPFNPQTTLSFTLPAGGHTEVVIYNLAGQKIRELVAGDLTPGSHNVVWDGRDDSGMPVSSGMFVSQLKTGDTVVTNRMTLVK